MGKSDREKTVKTRYGEDFWHLNALKGGSVTKARYGQAHYQRIGRLGGLKTQEIARKTKEMEQNENANL